MPRRRHLRKIVAPPDFKGYKPYGYHKKGDGCIDLLYEEYEAIKLTDYDLMTHEQASRLMGVSRATFARIYESARRKIAKALVLVKEIKTVYGHVYFDDHWFVCISCNSKFTIPEKQQTDNCPICKSEEVEPLQKN